MRKKLLLVAFILGSIFCVACSSEVKKEENTQRELQVDYNFKFDAEEIKNSGIGIHDGKIITDKNIALEYSNMIFEKVLKKDINKYKEVHISYDKEKGIWVINYGVGEETVGEDTNIAIDEKTGEVLLIWSGE